MLFCFRPVAGRFPGCLLFPFLIISRTICAPQLLGWLYPSPHQTMGLIIDWMITIKIVIIYPDNCTFWALSMHSHSWQILKTSCFPSRGYYADFELTVPTYHRWLLPQLSNRFSFFKCFSSNVGVYCQLPCLKTTSQGQSPNVFQIYCQTDSSRKEQLRWWWGTEASGFISVVGAAIVIYGSHKAKIRHGQHEQTFGRREINMATHINNT